MSDILIGTIHKLVLGVSIVIIIMLLEEYLTLMDMSITVCVLEDQQPFDVTKKKSPELEDQPKAARCKEERRGSRSDPNVEIDNIVDSVNCTIWGMRVCGT